MQAGDVLLLDTGAHFMQHHRKDRNFALVAEVSNSQPPRFDRVIIAVVCAVVAIALAIANVLDLFIGALAASGIMLLTGCLSGEAARRSVKWDVLVTIAAAFGISNAMENTGAVLCCCLRTGVQSQLCKSMVHVVPHPFVQITHSAACRSIERLCANIGVSDCARTSFASVQVLPRQ